MWRIGGMRFEFKLEDFWIGAFWRREDDRKCPFIDLWICLVPCVPLHITLIGPPFFKPYRCARCNREYVQMDIGEYGCPEHYFDGSDSQPIDAPEKGK